MLAVAALSAAWQQGMGKPPHYRVLYDHPDVPLVYEALSKVPGSGRIVLDLDHSNEHDWSVIWGESIALQAYAKRRHVDLACVNDNWHISYTKPGKCRPDELATDRRYEVRLTGAPDAARGAPEIEAGGLSFYRKGAVPRHEEYITVKDHPEYFRQVLGKGWAKVEGEFVWTEGPVAEIHLPADPARGRMLALDFGSFIPDAGLLHRVRAYANGRFAGESLYFYTQIRHRFTLDLGRDPGAAQDIRLEIGNPVSPKDYHVGDDPRYLAVSLYGIRKDPQ